MVSSINLSHFWFTNQKYDDVTSPDELKYKIRDDFENIEYFGKIQW